VQYVSYGCNEICVVFALKIKVNIFASCSNIGFFAGNGQPTR
jgi:hypothetical protein